MVGRAARTVPEVPLAPSLRSPQMNEDGHVSISRRGLIAAGLAVAAVGTMGVVSTMNAGAAETPTATAAADPVPPAVLPWGATPQPIKLGETGASSEALAAAGASAALPDPDSSSDVTAYGPKGESNRDGVVATSDTSVPPLPPPHAEPVSGTGEVDYLYALGKQEATVDGVAAQLTVAKPKLGAADWHSLAEIAVQSADGQQVVEVGWNVDRVTNGDENTHLFVYHWVDGKATCYNGCDFVPYAGATIAPGATLAADVIKPFGIQYSAGNWWIAYDSAWIGYFPDKIWNSTFTKGGLVQVFGEIAASSTAPCTEMGNGKIPDDTTAAAKFGSVTYVNGPTVVLGVTATSARYPTYQVTDRTFRYGGPAAC
jgi:Neprosin